MGDAKMQNWLLELRDFVMCSIFVCLLCIRSNNISDLLWGWHKEIAYQAPLYMPAPPLMMHSGTLELTICYADS